MIVEKPFSGKVEGIELDKEQVALIKGETATLIASIKPDAATNKEVVWMSTNENVATVANGVITAVATGQATIKVTTVEGGFVAECMVVVTNPLKQITIDQHEVSIPLDEQITLKATLTPADADEQTIVWTSSDMNIATVSNGVVTALEVGKTTIYAKNVDGTISDSCLVTVIKPIINVTSVTLDQVELTLDVPQTATLIATVSPEDADDKSVSWTSDNNEVATVADGLVTAIAAGTANITVTTTDGNFTATCIVTVRLVDGVMNIQMLDINAPMYDVLGRQVKSNYKGIVVQKGKAFLLK